uniref:CCT domain-containing protein n=1 Tax=Brassica campestris TaxID=3711 RepID=A0A3P5Z8X9_BRACM|nr:unnamed protein product [Brassica rapa]
MIHGFILLVAPSYYRPSLRGGSVVKLIGEEGAVIPVKNQGTHMWKLLGALGGWSGGWYKQDQDRELIYFWEQEFIDYYREDGNGGCDGGPCEDGFGNHDKADTSGPNVTIINQPGNAKSQHGLYPIKPSSPFGLVSTVGSPRARNEAKLRYKKKKLKHIIGKKVRYVSRRARAYPRKIVRGRFVKAGDNYDYDPSSLTMKSMSFLFP